MEPRNLNIADERPRLCDTLPGCGAPATGVWSAQWAGSTYCCDRHAPVVSNTGALPAGFTFRTLGPVPVIVPHTTGHLAVAGT